MEKSGGGSQLQKANNEGAASGRLVRPTSVDLEGFEECYSEPQWWHYQIMAINCKHHLDKKLIEEESK